MALQLERVKAERYEAFGGRYLILQEPETPWGGGPRMWCVYDQTYGDGGVCMEPVERLGEVREQLQRYHDEVLQLEAKRDNEDLPDHERVAAAIRLRDAMTPEQVADEFEWPLDRAREALQHPKQTATKSVKGAFGTF